MIHGSKKRSADMSDLYWLTDAQIAKLEPFFPKSRGKPRVENKRVLSGIIFIEMTSDPLGFLKDI